jgi:biotin carboxylase
MFKNIFVVGLDDFNLELLKPIGEKKSYEFHPLLSVHDVKRRKSYNSEELLEKADNRLKAFGKPVDAIVGYWDFPTTCLVPFLNRKWRLPCPSFESVLKCEHKFWSRMEQSRVLREIPKFCAFNPFEPDARSTVDLDFPFWIKPVKSFASQLGFRIHNEKEFESSVDIIRQKIFSFAQPFNYFLDQINLPQALKGIGGDWCIAEAIIAGRQCTLEGYVYKGQVEVYGVIDSIREPNRSTFARYQYPSQLPKRIQERMIQAAQKVMIHLQYDNAPFNVEFFYDAPHDRIWLLEINPRISQSHCDIFKKVDGVSHHEVMIGLALGERPEFPYRQGEYPCAAKIFLRTHEDAVAKRVPSEQEIQRVKEQFPGTLVNIHVREGVRLSDMPNQESYSYELGYICLGAQNEHELLERYRTCLKYLTFEYTFS